MAHVQLKDHDIIHTNVENFAHQVYQLFWNYAGR